MIRWPTAPAAAAHYDKHPESDLAPVSRLQVGVQATFYFTGPGVEFTSVSVRHRVGGSSFSEEAGATEQH